MLSVFDCNLKKYLFKISETENGLDLKFLQISKPTDLKASMFVNEYCDRYIAVLDQAHSINKEIIQWQTSSKSKLYLYMFQELANKKEYKNLFRDHDIFKAISLLR